MGAPYLRIAPLKVEVISESPLVAVLREFISPTEADELVRKAGTEPRYIIKKCVLFGAYSKTGSLNLLEAKSPSGRTNLDGSLIFFVEIPHRVGN